MLGNGKGFDKSITKECLSTYFIMQDDYKFIVRVSNETANTSVLVTAIDKEEAISKVEICMKDKSIVAFEDEYEFLEVIELGKIIYTINRNNDCLVY